MEIRGNMLFAREAGPMHNVTILSALSFLHEPRIDYSTSDDTYNVLTVLPSTTLHMVKLGQVLAGHQQAHRKDQWPS